MTIDAPTMTPFQAGVAERFGVLPNFFCTAAAAPGLVDELWGFARSAYLDSALPSLFKERLFVHLSRFCEIRYCIVRHVGFLVGLGRPAGDPDATPESVDDVIALLSRPTPDATQLAAALDRLSGEDRALPLPEPGTQAEGDLFDALTVIFVEPARSERARRAVRAAVGDQVFEMLAAYLAFVRTAHFWTETHPEIAFEPDMLALMKQRPDLQDMLLSPADAERVRAGGDLKRVLAELHQTEAALRESEARFRMLADNMSQLAWSCDSLGNVNWYNRRWLEYTGLSFDEMKSWGWEKVQHPDHVERVVAGVEHAAASGEPWEDTFPLLRHDGEYRWFYSQAVPVRDQRGEIVQWFGTNTDVTDQRQAVEALRGSEEREAFLLRLSDTLRPIRDPVQIMAEASALLGRHLAAGRCGYGEVDESGQYLIVHRDWTDGVMPSFRGTHLLEGFGPEFVAAYRAGRTVLIDDALADARAAGNEAAFEAAGGVRASLGVPMVKEGRFVAGVFVQQLQRRHWTAQEEALAVEVAERTWDAVERARAEQALRKSEERRDLALEATQVGTFVWHVKEDRGEPDARLLALFDQPSDGMMSLRYALETVIEPDDRERYAAAVAEASRPDGSREMQTDIRVRRADGGWRWLEIRGRVSFDEDGQPSRMAGTALNITERKQAEQQLRESEERQAFLLGLSDGLRTQPDATAVADFALRALRDQLGLDRCYIARMSVPDDWAEYLYQVGNERVPPMPAGVRISSYPEGLEAAPDGTWVIDDLAANIRSETDRRNLRAIGHGALVAAYVRKGEKGEPVWVLSAVSADPRHWTPGEIALIEETAERTWAAVERARTEAALRESEERFRQFGEASQDVLWIRNAETFEWEYLTPAFETIYGLGCEAALRGDNMTGWLELIVPEDRDHVKRSLERVRDGEWMTFEFRIRRPADGEIRWLRNTDFPIRDGSGKVVRIGGIGHDVTPMKDVERALAAAERRQRALVEGIPQLVWRAVDGGHWTWASPQWTAFTGQAEQDSHDWGWLDPVHPEDRERVKEIWAGAVDRGEFGADYRICHLEEHRYRWFQTRATPVRGEDGTIIEWLGTSTDVDELRRLQDLQKTLLAELQHRVRNVLAVIRSMMRRSSEGQESLSEYVQHLEGRLSALARTQVLLTRAVDARVDLEDLIRDELVAQAANDDKIALSGPDVGLGPKAAEVVSLAIHELTTNAVK